MYESAVFSAERRDRPLWHVGAGAMLFAGCLDYHKPHDHAVPLLLAGLYEPFLIRVAGGVWRRTKLAVIPAGRRYELAAGGLPVAVLYLEPEGGSLMRLEGLLDDVQLADGILLGEGASVAALRQLYEDPRAICRAGDVLDGLISEARQAEYQSPVAVDRRVAAVLSQLSEMPDEALSSEAAAGLAGVSLSHFQHLFQRQIGVSFSRYRGWRRLRAAIREVTVGANLTGAAHAAGFYDQAHFTRQFSRSFGAAPSRTLSNIRLCEAEVCAAFDSV